MSDKARLEQQVCSQFGWCARYYRSDDSPASSGVWCVDVRTGVGARHCHSFTSTNSGPLTKKGTKQGCNAAATLALATNDGAKNDEGGPLQRVTPLRIAVEHGRIDIIRELVKHKDIDLDKPGNTNEVCGFRSPLQRARRRGFAAIAKVLLDAGAKDDAAAADDEADDEE